MKHKKLKKLRQNYYGNPKCPICGRRFTVLNQRLPEISSTEGYKAVYQCPKDGYFVVTKVDYGSKEQEALAEVMIDNIPGIKDELQWEAWEDEWGGRKENRVGNVDIYLPKEKMVIEYDGLDHEKEGRPSKDKHKSQLLLDKGIKVIRIKEVSGPYDRENYGGYKTYAFTRNNEEEKNEAVKKAIHDVREQHRKRHYGHDCHCTTYNKDIDVNLKGKKKEIAIRKQGVNAAKQAAPLLGGMSLGMIIGAFSFNRKRR